MSRSSGLISFASARSIVVFPALVAPAIMMFLRAATAAERNAAISGVTEPNLTRSSRWTRERRERRIEMEGREHTSMTAERREPSGSRMSSCGFAESNDLLVRPE